IPILLGALRMVADGIVALRVLSEPATRSHNVVLIRPATVTTAEAVGEDAAPPLGVAYVASHLRQYGHKVSVVDGLGEAIDRYTLLDGLVTGMRHGLADDEIVD